VDAREQSTPGERAALVEGMLDRLLEGKRPEEIVGSGGLLEDLTKRVLERALEGELTDHLGYEKHATEGRNGFQASTRG
jgi:transposase-like protein